MGASAPADRSITVRFGQDRNCTKNARFRRSYGELSEARAFGTRTSGVNFGWRHGSRRRQNGRVIELVNLMREGHFGFAAIGNRGTATADAMPIIFRNASLRRSSARSRSLQSRHKLRTDATEPDTVKGYRTSPVG